MTDRDTFAAAALTGYTANPAWDDAAASIVAEQAYADADAMLAERSRAGQKMSESDIPRAVCPVRDSSTNNDAATREPGGSVGLSPGSSSDPINRNAERESPRGECGGSSLRDVARPDTKGKVAGGPEPSFSDRPKPVKDDDSDRSKPISDNRLAALEELSAMDQELELKHGITGNPMIKARRNKESAWAGITDAGPRLRQMNDVLEENERLRGQLAWTQRERDSLRCSIDNLRDYVAELSAELYAESDEKRVLYDTKRDTRETRNGALSDEEREAIKVVIGGFGMWVAQNGLTDDESLRRAVLTIRGLLERMK